MLLPTLRYLRILQKAILRLQPLIVMVARFQHPTLVDIAHHDTSDLLANGKNFSMQLPATHHDRVVNGRSILKAKDMIEVADPTDPSLTDAARN